MYKILNIKTNKIYDCYPGGPQPDGTYQWDCYYMDDGVKKIITDDDWKNFENVDYPIPKDDHKEFVKSFPKDIRKAIIEYETAADEDIRHMFEFDGKSLDEIREMLGVK